ncbi:MAG: hypothetical protein KatS3mg114_0303 [Planctomycetaceae bacterium]|nr:MAG: hypothetical protein KatS3mg114_0303 [Planctomycetaceae bacterium]
MEQQFRAAGFRVTSDLRSCKINAKIRDAQLELIPYMLIVGGRDQEQGTVSIRDRLAGDLGAFSVPQALEKFRTEVAQRTIRQVNKTQFQAYDQHGSANFEY